MRKIMKQKEQVQPKTRNEIIKQKDNKIMLKADENIK